MASTILTAVGLTLDLIGVILFAWDVLFSEFTLLLGGLPKRMSDIEEGQVVTFRRRLMVYSNRSIEGLKIRSRLGIELIFFGFLFQFLSAISPLIGSPALACWVIGVSTTLVFTLSATVFWVLRRADPPQTEAVSVPLRLG